jgi:hypothetical protein
MQLRRILLRIMLGSLALAAVVGALAILVAAEDVIWRVVGTAMATAVAAALMLGMSLLMDHEKTRSAGTLGMGTVVVQFLLCIGMIWELGHLIGWSGWDRDFAPLLTIFFLLFTVAPAMLFLRLRLVPQGRIAADTGLVLAALVFVSLMIATWTDWSWSRREEWWESSSALAIFGAAAVCCLVGLGTDRRHWRFVGLAACAAGLAIAVVAIWRHLEEGSGVFIIICSIAGLVAHANLAMFCPLKPGQFWLRYGTILCVLLTAIFIDADAVLHPRHGRYDSDLLMRLAGASGFVAACGSLALLILARLNQRFAHAPILAEIKQITLICPGCQKKHTFDVGQAQCPTCKLRIHTRIEEPRCPNCDYLLYMLQSDRCPECGQLVADQPPVAQLQ